MTIHSSILFSTHVPAIRRAVAPGAPDRIFTNFAVLGGVSRTVRVIGACGTMGVGSWCCSGDAGIATAGNLCLSAAMLWITGPSQFLFRWQVGDVIGGGTFRRINKNVHVPECSDLGVEIDRAALAQWHNHLVENGPLGHVHDPAMPRRFRRLPLNRRAIHARDPESRRHRRQKLPSHAKVVVIGGGGSGCSILFHLAKFGWNGTG